MSFPFFCFDMAFKVIQLKVVKMGIQMIVEKQNCEMIVIFENARGWLWMSRVWPDSENPDENLKTAPPSFLSMALDGWRDYENLICEKGTIQYRYTTGFSTQNHWPPKKSSLTFSDFVSKTSNVGSRISSEQWKKRFLRIYWAWNPTHLFMWLLYFINVINHDIRIPIKQPGPRFFWLTWNLTKPGGIPISQPLFFLRRQRLHLWTRESSQYNGRYDSCAQGGEVYLSSLGLGPKFVEKLALKCANDW